MFNKGKLPIDVYKGDNEIDNKDIQYLKFNNLPIPIFFMLLIGEPKSGKTNLLKDLLLNKKHKKFYGIFDTLHIFSNSIDDFRNSPLKNFLHPLEINEIKKVYESLEEFKEIPLEESSKKYKQLMLQSYNASEDDLPEPEKKPMLNLFIFDDCTEFIKKHEDFFAQLAQNRRHTHPVSIIMITHWYNRIPKRVRTIANYIIMFRPKSRIESDELFKQRPPVRDIEHFNDILQDVYRDSHDFLYIDYDNNKIYRNFDFSHNYKTDDEYIYES